MGQEFKWVTHFEKVNGDPLCGDERKPYGTTKNSGQVSCRKCDRRLHTIVKAKGLETFNL